MKTLLISMPWSRKDILSIQLGGLKAYLQKESFCVESRHYYKDILAYIGKDIYSDIVVNSLGDLVFSPLYTPEKMEDVKEYLQGRLGETFDFDELYRNVVSYVNDILYNDVNWGEYTNIAFSTSLVQFVPSLYLAKRIKEIHPHVNIIFGGASLVDEIAKSVISTFDEVDFVIKGEGELTLAELLHKIEEGKRDYHSVAGIVFREPNGNVVETPNRQLMCNIDDLPTPQFDDYFTYSLRDAEYYPPIITVEASRGCFWGRCSFCNLNSQWHNTYREKSAEKVSREIYSQSEQYRLLDFFFTDSNVSNKENLFGKLKQHKKDYVLHAEVSGHLSHRDFIEMRDAGMRDIQIGIEAFSSSLLKKYTKGVSVMRNIEMLKWCTELGISVFYNVITGFPTTTQEEIDETLKNMSYAQYYQFPAITGYSLSYQSEVYQNFSKYNIKGWTVPENVKALYEEKFLGKTAPLLSAIVGYEVIQDTESNVNWNDVVDFSSGWEKTFAKNMGKSGLVYYDGGNYLVVKKSLYDRMEQYTLEGFARDIYLFCSDESKSFASIKERFPTRSESEISDLIDELYALELMFCENNYCFSLAVNDGQ